MMLKHGLTWHRLWIRGYLTMEYNRKDTETQTTQSQCLTGVLNPMKENLMRVVRYLEL